MRSILAAALALVLATAAAGQPIEHRLAVVPSFSSRADQAREQDRAITRIADGLGIPYAIVADHEELAGFDVAVLASGPGNAQLDPIWLEALYEFVEAGGVLLAPGLIGSDLYPLFGIESIESSRTRYRLTFDGSDPALAFVDHPRERTISLGNGTEELFDQVIWSHAARLDPFAEPLARFDDGGVGFSVNYYGRGSAYYLGLSFVESVLLPQAGGDYEAQRSFINDFEPSADVIMLIVRALYEANASVPITVGTIPDGRPTALVLTHDVDAQTSFVDSLKFARLEREFGVTSTFFETTKYFVDNADIGYYSVPENLAAIRELASMGFDIGSHTVTHALEFGDAAPGPANVTRETYGAPEELTINGEVRVSKALLDADIPGQRTITFRSGYLAFPRELIGVLEDAGYQYDSSFAANDILTSFPYFAMRERRVDAEVSAVIEIPVTFDDALDFLSPDRVDEAVAVWTDVVRAQAANESISVFLMHPSDTRDREYKLRAQRALMEHARDAGAWMGNLTEFGRFWRARSDIRITAVEPRGGRLVVHTTMDQDDLGHGITIVVRSRARSELAGQAIDLLSRDGAKLDYGTTERDGDLFLVPVGSGSR